MDVMPYKLKFQLTSECHSRCITCPVWKRLEKNKHIQLSLDTLKQIITDFKELQNYNKKPEVHFAGMGEPFYYPHILELFKLCSDLNLYSIVVTNTMPLNKGNLIPVIESGLNLLIVSLNNHIPEIHNYSRGLDNYDHIMKVTDFIHEYKLKHNLTKPDICVSSLLADFNYHNYIEFIEWFHKQEKFESFNFNIISNFDQPNFKLPKEIDNLISTIDKIIDNYNKYPLLDVPIHILKEMRGYVKEGYGYTAKRDCTSSLTNIFIEKDFKVRFCFDKRGFSLGDVSKESLKEILTKKINQKILRNNYINGCRNWCAISNCIYG